MASYGAVAHVRETYERIGNLLFRDDVRREQLEELSDLLGTLQDVIEEGLSIEDILDNSDWWPEVE